MRTLIAIIKLLAFAIFTLLLVIPQIIVLQFTKSRKSYILPHVWEKIVCQILGIRIHIHGSPETKHQTAYISNHLSYLDIPTLGSILKASFVAKRDVSGWPVFGFLSKMQQTAFISRTRTDAGAGSNTLESMLEQGKNLIMFPEGTSTDGQTIYPFKSSLFSIFFKNEQAEIAIQPITLKIITVDGHTVQTQQDRDLYAWHINMDTPLPAHLWTFAKSKGAVIDIIFHPVIWPKDTKDRKTLAKTCHDAVSNGMTNHQDIQKQARGDLNVEYHA